MTKMFLSLSMIFISMFMIFINHPISMGLMILLQTLLLCLISGFIINTYWFSYILFLIFLGGLLVLFIYVSSVASNELFKFSPFNLYTPLIMFILLLMSYYLKMNLNWLNFNFNEEMINLFYNYIFFNNENKMDLTKLYNYNYYLMLMLIIYLFITLIAVVKITNIFFGPLRSINF